MKSMRPALPGQVCALWNARQALRQARDYAKDADAPKAVEAIRRALKSLDGARRHYDRRNEYRIRMEASS